MIPHVNDMFTEKSLSAADRIVLCFLNNLWGDPWYAPSGTRLETCVATDDWRHRSQI